MSNQVADVELDEVEDSQDDMGDVGDVIAQETEKFYQKEFETLRGEGQEQDAPKGEAAKPEREPSNNQGRRPGIDEVNKVISEVETTIGKDNADVLRKIQQNYTRTRTEWKIAQKEWQNTLKDLQGEINALKNGGVQPNNEEEVDPDLARLSEQQHQLFEKLARSKGLISKEDLEKQAAEEQAKNYVKSEVESALEKFGDRFGYIDEDGEFVYSDEIKDEVEDTYNRVFDPNRGLTAKDLFILAQHDRLMEEAQVQAQKRASVVASKNGKMDQIRRAASTERRSTSAQSSSVPVYRKGEGLDKVVQRAFAQAYREI